MIPVIYTKTNHFLKDNSNNLTKLPYSIFVNEFFEEELTIAWQIHKAKIAIRDHSSIVKICGYHTCGHTTK